MDNMDEFIKDDVNTRTAEILFGNQWIEIAPIAIVKGDTFRMFEKDGTPVLGLRNETEFLALSNAYFNKDIITIDT